MYNQNIGKDRNYENVFIRNCIISVLSILDCQLILEYKFEKEKKVIPIPFFYTSNNKQFNDDAYLDDMPHEFRFSEANMDQAPVGYIDLTGVSIDSGEITNPNVPISFNLPVPDEDGEIIYKPFLENVRNIPLTLSMNCGIKLNSEGDVHKIITEIMDVLWSFGVINFEYYGKVIPLAVEFPDSNDIEITKVNNGLESSLIEVKFSIDVKVTYPAFRKPYKNNPDPNFTKRVQWYNTIKGVNDGNSAE